MVLFLVGLSVFSFHCSKLFCKVSFRGSTDQFFLRIEWRK